MRAVESLEAAQKELPFAITLPVYLPNSTKHAPEIELTTPPDEPADMIRLVYREQTSEGLRVVIMEGPGEFSLERYSPETLEINGVSVGLVGDPGGFGTASVWTSWKLNRVAFSLDCTLIANGSDQGPVSEVLREEAISVVKGMIDKRGPTVQ